MDLFTYLMANKGNKTPVNDDLFAYLLGKNGAGTIKTATGSVINITDATKVKIVSLTLSKESTQDGTPTPENPIDVDTIKGNVEITISNGTNTRNYTIPLGNNEICGIGNYKDELVIDKNGHCWLNKKVAKKIYNGSEEEDWRYISVAEGSLFRVSTSPTGVSRIIDLCNRFKGIESASGRENGDFYYRGSSVGFDFIYNAYTNVGDFKEWLSTHNVIVYYPQLESEIIDLNYTVNISLFKGVNNISNSDDMDMTLKYY